MSNAARRWGRLVPTWLLVGALAALASGCSSVRSRVFHVCNVQRGDAQAFDVQTSPIPFISSSHRVIGWRGEDGVCHVELEDSGGSALSSLENLPTSALNHFTFGPTL